MLNLDKNKPKIIIYQLIESFIEVIENNKIFLNNLEFNRQIASVLKENYRTIKKNLVCQQNDLNLQVPESINSQNFSKAFYKILCPIFPLTKKGMSFYVFNALMSKALSKLTYKLNINRNDLITRLIKCEGNYANNKHKSHLTTQQYSLVFVNFFKKSGVQFNGRLQDIMNESNRFYQPDPCSCPINH